MPKSHDKSPSQVSFARLRRIGGLQIAALAALVVFAAIAVVALSDRSSQAESPRELALRRNINGLLGGIPQSGDALGSPSAPVTLRFFGDLECPTSRAFAVEALPVVISKWVRDGKLRIEYHSLRTATSDPATFTAQQAAALAAGEQNRLWDYIEYFYHRQGPEGSGYVTERFLRRLAEQTPGLDVKRWNADRKDPPLTATVAADEQTAVRHGLDSTPALVVGRSQGGGPAGHRLYVVEPAALGFTIEGLLRDQVKRSSSPMSDDLGRADRLKVAYVHDGDRRRMPC